MRILPVEYVAPKHRERCARKLRPVGKGEDGEIPNPGLSLIRSSVVERLPLEQDVEGANPSGSVSPSSTVVAAPFEGDGFRCESEGDCEER